MFVAYTLPSIYHPYSHQLKWFSAGGGTVPEGSFLASEDVLVITLTWSGEGRVTSDI